MVDILIVVLYLLVTLYIGMKSSEKIKTMKDYAIGNRRYPTVVLVATLLATLLGGNATLGMAEKGFSVGVAYIAICLGLPIAHLFSAKFIAPRITKFADMISTGDIMHSFYGRKGRIITGISGLLLSIGSIGAQVSGIGYIFQFFLDIPHVVGILIGCGIVVLYSTFGGIRSVTLTDVVQFGVLIIAIPVICNIGLRKIGGYEALFEMVPAQNITFFHEDLPKSQLISLFFVFCIPYLNPTTIQRFLMAKDAKQAQMMYKVTAALVFPYFFLVGIIGMTALAIAPDIEASLALPHLVQTAMPLGLKGLAIAGMLAVIMSTADSDLNSGSITLIHDIIKPLRKKRFTDAQELRATRIATCAIGCAAIGASLTFKSIVDIIMGFFGFWGSVALIPLIAGMLGFVPDRRCFFTAVIAGFGTFFGWKLLGLSAILGLDGLAPSIAVNALAFFGSAYFIWPQKKEEKPIQPTPRQPTAHMRARPTPEMVQKMQEQTGLQMTPEKIPLHKKILNFSTQQVEEFGAQYTLFGTFAVLNYILPYFMWADLTMPHFDTFVTLRVVSGVMCFLLIMSPYWPPHLLKYRAIYWHFTLMFCLPMAGTFFFLDSGLTLGWLLNMVLVLFLMAILVDWKSFLVLVPLGAFLGCLLFWAHGGSLQAITISRDTESWGLYMAIFSILIGLLFSRNKERWVIERFGSMKMLSGAIAHEMRTPLSTIGYSTRVLERHLPGLLKLHETVKAQGDGIQVQDIDARSWDSLQTLPERLRGTSRKAQSVIDMLLVKLRESTPSDLEECSADACIKQALEAYPFDEKEQDLITYKTGEDFPFKGDQELITHVLFNLIKNALYHIKAANKGEITISLKTNKLENAIFFKDTGPGIPYNQREAIFEKFYSKSKHGTGIGLAFCKKVMKSFEGDIVCNSVEGEYTEFVLIFPNVNAAPRSKNALGI